ncbi:MAG: radical SAM protein [Candidatus Deferrimicrobium sp.]
MRTSGERECTRYAERSTKGGPRSGGRSCGTGVDPVLVEERDLLLSIGERRRLGDERKASLLVGAGELRADATGDAPFGEADMQRVLSTCKLCPRECGVNRLEGERGFCGAGRLARVAAVSVHHGEEPPISGSRGSGTIFFSHCNMKCLFCQNYPISQYGNGREMDTETLAGEMLRIRERGVHNVNFVTPTPHVPQMLEAVLLARGKGFDLPVVYNTNGYDALETLALLDGVVDIYLPDAKYLSAELAGAASGTPDYALHNEGAIDEMVRQVGFLSAGDDGIATRGVLVRHLVLPGRVGETEAVLARLAARHGPELPLSLMGQYFPAWRAGAADGFDRKLTRKEYDRAIGAVERLGFRNAFIQER